MTYGQKLKDPRWQRLRLKVMEDDGWACVDCGSTTDTLHVHHLFYERGREPWDYDVEDLVTLCEGCHKDRTEALIELHRAIRHQTAADLLAIARVSRFGVSMEDVLEDHLRMLDKEMEELLCT